MEWEVGLIEWIQKTFGSLNSSVGKALSFIGGDVDEIMEKIVE